MRINNLQDLAVDLDIEVDDLVSSREKMIDYYRNAKWLNKEWDRDNSIYAYDGFGRCSLIRHSKRDNYFSVNIITQNNIDSNWVDDEWIEILSGCMNDIDRLINQEFYDNLIPQLKKYLTR